VALPGGAADTLAQLSARDASPPLLCLALPGDAAPLTLVPLPMRSLRAASGGGAALDVQLAPSDGGDGKVPAEEKAQLGLSVRLREQNPSTFPK